MGEELTESTNVELTISNVNKVAFKLADEIIEIGKKRKYEINSKGPHRVSWTPPVVYLSEELQNTIDKYPSTYTRIAPLLWRYLVLNGQDLKDGSEILVEYHRLIDFPNETKYLEIFMDEFINEFQLYERDTQAIIQTGYLNKEFTEYKQIELELNRNILIHRTNLLRIDILISKGHKRNSTEVNQFISQNKIFIKIIKRIMLVWAVRGAFENCYQYIDDKVLKVTLRYKQTIINKLNGKDFIECHIYDRINKDNLRDLEIIGCIIPNKIQEAKQFATEVRTKYLNTLDFKLADNFEIPNVLIN